MSLARKLPIELVDKILLFRPTHPTALLIQDFMKFLEITMSQKAYGDIPQNYEYDLTKFQNREKILAVYNYQFCFGTAGDRRNFELDCMTYGVTRCWCGRHKIVSNEWCNRCLSKRSAEERKYDVIDFQGNIQNRKWRLPILWKCETSAKKFRENKVKVKFPKPQLSFIKKNLY